MTDYLATLRHELREAAAREYPAEAPSHEQARQLVGADEGAHQRRPRPRAALRARHGSRRHGARWLAPALALATGLVIVAVVLTAGGSPSIVSRAYAATTTDGVIVHYVETFHSQQGGTTTTSNVQVWTSGRRRHVIVTPAHGSPQEIAFDGSHEQNFMNGTLYTFASPEGVANHCGRAGTLAAACVLNQPLAALRTLYHAGRLHAFGTRAVADGRRADVITGAARGLELRALVDPHTFIPIQIRLTQRFRPPPPIPSFSVTETITGYQRLPLTAQTQRLLLMGAHSAARVVHLCINGSRCTTRRTR